MDHTEHRGGPVVPSPYQVKMHDLKRCQCGKTLISNEQLCDQCSRRDQFTALGNNVVNQSGGAS